MLLSTLTVTNPQDSGTGSLRAEIAAAHSGDTVVFAPSMDGKTITLTSGELLIKQNLTIAGPGAGQLTVRGNYASRVFEVSKGTKSVTLSGLTVSNGIAANGGGIYNQGTMTISNSIVSGNSASGSGGGIDNEGTMTISNSIVSGNSCYSDGGGINNGGTLTVSGTTVSQNETNWQLGYGGGIANSGTLTVGGSMLSSDVAAGGGGLFNTRTATVNSGSTLSGNIAYGAGGGILSGGGVSKLTVSGTTLSANTSYENGGGIFVSAFGTVTLSNCSLSANVAHNDGGAVFVTNGGTVTISSSTVSGNSALMGGGIYNFGGTYGSTVTVENFSSINGNTAPVGADVETQGVLYLDSSSVIGILDGNPPLPF